MITASRFKVLTTALAALALAGCSSSYGDYDDHTYEDSHNYYGNSYAGKGYDMSGYGMTGYGMTGANMSANCIAGAYKGGFTQGGLRNGRYGNPVVATGNVEFYGQKSRYGSWEQTTMDSAGCMGGYWMVPTYQVIQQPPAVTTSVAEPVVTTVLETCPEGQYRMDNGDCAIMMIEEPEQYVPPVTSSYPPISTVTEEWYNPIRK